MSMKKSRDTGREPYNKPQTLNPKYTTTETPRHSDPHTQHAKKSGSKWGDATTPSESLTPICMCGPRRRDFPRAPHAHFSRPRAPSPHPRFPLSPYPCLLSLPPLSPSHLACQEPPKSSDPPSAPPRQAHPTRSTAAPRGDRRPALLRSARPTALPPRRRPHSRPDSESTCCILHDLQAGGRVPGGGAGESAGRAHTW